MIKFVTRHVHHQESKHMNLAGTCVLLLICSNRSATTDIAYQRSLEVWNENSNASETKVYATDSCGTIATPFKNIRSIRYAQPSQPTHNRRRLSGFERLAMLASLDRLKKDNCDFVIKVTGKYPLPSIKREIERAPKSAALLLSSRGESYGGWSSEIFGAKRELLTTSLLAWKDKRNTESFVERLRINHTFHIMHKMKLPFPVMRSSDKRILTHL